MSASSTRQRAVVITEQQEQRMSERFGAILRISLITAIGLILVGAVLSFVRNGQLPSETVPFGELPGTAIQADADALLTLGILGLLAAPALGLMYLAIAFVQSRDRRFSLIAAGVLFILIISLPIGLVTRGA